MAEHASLTQATGINVYFADAHSPWQRLVNENTKVSDQLTEQATSSPGTVDPEALRASTLCAATSDRVIDQAQEAALRTPLIALPLLVLARTDARDAPVEVENLDLAVLVAEGVSASQQNRPDLTFRFDYAPCEFRGNRLALRSLMANLLDNAARHTRTTVDVSVTVSGGQARIQVDDDGRGLSPEDCERVFERFVRLDESRDRDEGGSGLGLAIVASIAESHGGRAFAAPGPGGNFTITLRDSSSTLRMPTSAHCPHQCSGVISRAI